MSFSRFVVQSALLATFMAMGVGCCAPCGSFVSNQQMPPVGPDGGFAESCNDCGGYHAAVPSCHVDFCMAPPHTMPAPSPPTMLGRFHAVPTDNVFGPDDSGTEVTAYAETQPELDIQMLNEPPIEPGQFRPQPSENRPPSGNAREQSLLTPVATDAKKPKSLRRRKATHDSVRLAGWTPARASSSGSRSSSTGSSRTGWAPLSAPTTKRASTKSPFLTADAIPWKDRRSASTKKPEWKPVR